MALLAFLALALAKANGDASLRHGFLFNLRKTLHGLSEVSRLKRGRKGVALLALIYGYLRARIGEPMATLPASRLFM